LRGQRKEDGERPSGHTGGARRVNAGRYTEAYFLTDCEGHETFVASAGRRIGERFQRALKLARLRPAERLLDIGCGRGEIVVGGVSSGAIAVGVDYAPAAVRLAQSVLESLPAGLRPRAAVAQMDAAALALQSVSFDALFMLDLVEHLYPQQLTKALAEAYRVLRPGGRLILHTSPNRLFEEVMYPRYVRHIHRAVLALSKAGGYRGDLVNLYGADLPTAPTWPHRDCDRQLHVNEHGPQELRGLLEAHGFRVRLLDFWEPPYPPFYSSLRLNIEVKLLDLVRYFRPISRYPPLNRFFCNHIWIVAERPR
jgi:SAM-dependent methyltransferase